MGAALQPFAGEPAPTAHMGRCESCGSGFTREGPQSGPNYTELRLMRSRQKLVRLHLQQTAQRTLELEAQPPAGVQILQLNLS